MGGYALQIASVVGMGLVCFVHLEDYVFAGSDWLMISMALLENLHGNLIETCVRVLSLVESHLMQ